jgi:hypothetical protein
VKTFGVSITPIGILSAFAISNLFVASFNFALANDKLFCASSNSAFADFL